MNNSELFNAVVAGAGGGCNERWLTSSDQSAYAVFSASVQAFANIVDSQIPTIAGGASIAEIDLLQSVVQGVLSDRLITSITIADYLSIAQAMAALFQKMRTVLSPLPVPQTNMVLVDAADTTPGFLSSKTVAGAGIQFVILNPGGNEQLAIVLNASASLIQNDSSVTGLSVKDALNNLLARVPSVVPAPTQNGQVLYSNGGVWNLLNAGTNTSFLQLNAGLPAWQNARGATGNILYCDGVGWQQLAIGAESNRLTVVGGLPAWANSANISKFSTNNNPIGVWNFENTLNDSGPNALNLTTEGGGTATFTDALPGYRGYYNPTAGRLIGPNNAIFNIPGDKTIFYMFQSNTQADTPPIVMFGNPGGGAQADNFIYNMTHSLPGPPLFSQEHGARVASSYTPSNVNSPFIHNLIWGCWRLSSNVAQFWLNGRKLGAASGALTTPDGGANGRFRIGGTVTAGNLSAIICGVKLIASALTDQQVVDEWNFSMGKLFGTI